MLKAEWFNLLERELTIPKPSWLTIAMTPGHFVKSLAYQTLLQNLIGEMLKKVLS